MKYKPYEFNPDDAYQFSRHIGIPAVARGGELHFKQCPYCRGTGKGNEKSFAIDLKTGAFHCLRSSCGVNGNMITLSKDFDFSLGNEIDEYYRPKRKFRRLKSPEKEIEPKPPAVEYLTGRGISEEVIKRYQITVQNNHDNILVFPFFDENKILQFVKYRKTDFDKDKDTNKEWCESDCKPILFGMAQCNDKFDRLIITEGQIDSLSVATSGIENAVSVPTGAKGYTWVPYCWDWINQFHEIIVFGDYEKGHITLLDELSHRLKIIIKHVREEDYLDGKDANEILKKHGADQIRKCVENAVPVPVKKVIDLADVKNVDVFKLEKLKTGINLLDRLLYGGFPFGGTVLITAKSGSGKSTLASQIIVNAVAQKYKCFVYSGELPNYLFKGWMDFQIAGARKVFAYKNSWGDENYNISETNRKLISEWYRGSVFLYDNSSIDGDEKETLLQTVENVVMRYGVRVVLLDNLMTAMDLEVSPNNDKYEQQSVFVKSLARLALRHNILILLVAHKRKNNYSKDENDEISGSSDIGNLALITVSYDKGKDIDEDARLLKVTKNRLFGKVNTTGWVVNYDPKSKRIYGTGDDVNADFGWDTESDGFVDAEETPFD